jgi:hypothetical protein
MVAVADAIVIPSLFPQFGKALGIDRLSYQRSSGLWSDLGIKDSWGKSSLPAVPYMKQRHGARWQVVFCDDHVENLSIKALFDPRDNNVVRRWNRDHQPHRENLPGI